MPKSLSFPEIAERVQQFHATHNTPKAGARRAVYELSSLLADLPPADRAEILALLRDEVLSEPVPAS